MKENALQHRRLMTATIFTFIFMSGYALTYTMLGTLLPSIIQHYSLSISQASYINIALELGGTSAMVLALFLLDRINKGKALLFMALFFGLISLYIGSAPPFVILLAARFFMGLSWTTSAPPTSPIFTGSTGPGMCPSSTPCTPQAAWWPPSSPPFAMRWAAGAWPSWSQAGSWPSPPFWRWSSCG